MFAVQRLLSLCKEVKFQIPNVEGKAGMAAIYDPKGELDLEQLARGLRDRLPSFARPLFSCAL